VNETLVKQIVDGVMEQLQSGSGAARAADGRAASTHPRECPAPLTQGEPLVLAEAVLTGEMLAGRVNGQREILIAPQTVLTPSARDFLRERNVRHRRQPSVGNALRAESTDSAKRLWTIIIAATGSPVEEFLQTDGDLAPLCRVAASQTEGFFSAVELTATGEGGVVLICTEPEVAACRANRNTNIRAAVIRDALQGQRLKQSLGVNLAVIDSTGRNGFEVRHLIQAVIKGPPPRPPSGWNDLESGG